LNKAGIVAGADKKKKKKKEDFTAAATRGVRSKLPVIASSLLSTLC